MSSLQQSENILVATVDLCNSLNGPLALRPCLCLPRKNGIETASVGMSESPKATKTAGAPVNVAEFLLVVEEDVKDNDVGRDTPVAGNN